MNTANLGKWRLRTAFRTGKPFAALTLSLAALALAGGWLNERARAGSNAAQKEVDLALADTLQAVLANSACPKDLPSIEAVANELLPMMHPELNQYNKPQDPGALAAEEATNWSILHPGEEHAQRMADPAYREHVASALAGIEFGVAQSADKP